MTTPSSAHTDTVGPVRYTYDNTALTRAEIDLPLPPEFSETVFAVKLLPKEYEKFLGSEGCSYGISTGNHECTSEEEVGIAFAILERPVGTYRRILEAEASPGLDDQTFAGVKGFRYSRRGANRVHRYTYLPVNGRTLLLAYMTAPGSDAAKAALESALASIELPSS